MLTVENLVKEFNNTTAVNNISFTVRPGSIFGLLGPNGAGKTTTIRTILNIIKPTSGNILFNGSTITDEFFNIIGYLPEERGLYRKSKVIDTILYFAELKNLPRQKAIREADKWFKKLGIEEYRDRKLEQLSKGNQQKVQFITSVIHDPQLMIFDEPFAGFDPINQQEIKDLIFSFQSEGKIIILSTHQMDTAEKLCSEIFLINNGEEVRRGTLATIRNEFGLRHIKLEFNGDGAFINNLPEVASFDNYGNYAEIKLNDNINPSEFLKKIIGKLDIYQYSVIEPTLNQIFIDLIKKDK